LGLVLDKRARELLEATAGPMMQLRPEAASTQTLPRPTRDKNKQMLSHGTAADLGDYGVSAHGNREKMHWLRATAQRISRLGD
jgi:hypothetical protein